MKRKRFTEEQIIGVLKEHELGTGTADSRQLDFLLNDDLRRQKCELITNTIDKLNRKFGKRVLTLGAWMPPPGGYAGGKIAYNRIPSAEDFW